MLLCTVQHSENQAVSDSVCDSAGSGNVTSCLGYCNSLLAGLPLCFIKHLQMVQNATACLIFNHPNRAHVTPLLIALHWLLVAAQITFKSLVLAYRVISGSTPYLNSIILAYAPSRTLCSSQEHRLALPFLRTRLSQSRLLSRQSGNITVHVQEPLISTYVIPQL